MKKTRSMLALLACLALLVTLCTVTVSAAETVTSAVDFTTMPVADAGEASNAAMEAAGLIIPEGSNWHLVDHFYHVAMPKDGYAKTYYIQTLDAGEGKVLVEDAVMNIAYMLAAVNNDGSEYDVGWIVVSVSTDGENFTEVWYDEEGQGKMYDVSAVGIKDVVLTGTAGASKIWVKIEVERHAGESSGAIGWTKITGTAAKEGEISNKADFTTLTPAAGGADSNAAMESLGITVPEGSNWQIVDHFGICIIPMDGYAKTYYIQTLDAGEGKVLAEDATLDLSYALAAFNNDGSEYDVGWFVVFVSTDGENYTEVWYNEEGQGKMYDASAFIEDKITLTGTAGASKIWVKVEVERHAGETSGLVKSSVLTGMTKDAEVVNPDPEPTVPETTIPEPTVPETTIPESTEPENPQDPSNPGTGDIISMFAALAAISAAGIVITGKKSRKEN